MNIVICRYCKSPNRASIEHLFCTQCSAPLPALVRPEWSYAPNYNVVVNDTARSLYDLAFGLGSAFLEVAKASDAR